LKSNSELDLDLDLDFEAQLGLDLDLDLDFGAWTLVWTWTLGPKTGLYGKVRGREIGLWFWTWTSCASLPEMCQLRPGRVL
jgi:hypothetical protein